MSLIMNGNGRKDLYWLLLFEAKLEAVGRTGSSFPTVLNLEAVDKIG